MSLGRSIASVIVGYLISLYLRLLFFRSLGSHRIKPHLRRLWLVASYMAPYLHCLGDMWRRGSPGVVPWPTG
jgi:hypothetical protein